MSKSHARAPSRLKAMKDLVVDDKDAIRQYAEKFGECRDGTDSGASLTASLCGCGRLQPHGLPLVQGPCPEEAGHRASRGARQRHAAPAS